MKKTKLGVIGTVGVPAKYGGFETLVHQLVLNLGQKVDMTVYSSGVSYTKEERVSNWEGAKIKYIPLKANGVQSIPYDIFSMIHAMIFCDVLLVLGVSGCIFLPIVKLFTNKRVIVNVDGLEWRRAKWDGWVKKFLIFSEQMAARYADRIITDNAALQDYIKDHYEIDSSLVEYGADHASPIAISTEFAEKYPFLADKYAFSVCRIEPENNIHMILEACSHKSDLPLVLVGNWKNSDYGLELLEKYSTTSHFHLLDPIYESKELNTLRFNCHLYLHGHSAGGTNPSLVEAMYLGLSVIAFDVIYNRVTTEEKGIYFNNAGQLLSIMNRLSTSQIKKLGTTMKSIADRRYTWATISNKYQQVVADTEPLTIKRPVLVKKIAGQVRPYSSPLFVPKRSRVNE